ncbi:MAG: replication protein [Bacteroidota bacterium]
MQKSGTTPVPNTFFDTFLRDLKSSEVMILLIIIRQTLGWIDKNTGKRKKRDWISNTQFQKKTGLSPRTISNSICSLCNKGLIVPTNKKGKVLISPQDRQGEIRTFYSCSPKLLNIYPTTSAKNVINLQQNLLTTKKTNTNKTTTKKRHNSTWKKIGEVIGDYDTYNPL